MYQYSSGGNRRIKRRARETKILERGCDFCRGHMQKSSGSLTRGVSFGNAVSPGPYEAGPWLLTSTYFAGEYETW